jgi:hypothetical protein
LVPDMFCKFYLVKNQGLGKSTYTFSAERLLLSAPRQASVGRATWRGSGMRKSTDVRQKMYMLIYPDPKNHKIVIDTKTVDSI